MLTLDYVHVLKRIGVGIFLIAFNVLWRSWIGKQLIGGPTTASQAAAEHSLGGTVDKHPSERKREEMYLVSSPWAV